MMRTAPPMIVQKDGASPTPANTHTGPRTVSSGLSSPTSAADA
eukprot:CAMPEP_0174710542 /NCGR_PEP_ID=MMETSP1094-20130205/12150_1 /TAXON_ID=156173 /ORGANISM="Chrysochromulina brevifilum, Strain UTEX LB 985" /LENGTH=42 /DNA_ID= /DNA_START= /DNA_END= /DNA_ORIENTATION=